MYLSTCTWPGGVSQRHMRTERSVQRTLGVQTVFWGDFIVHWIGAGVQWRDGHAWKLIDALTGGTSQSSPISGHRSCTAITHDGHSVLKVVW